VRLTAEKEVDIFQLFVDDRCTTLPFDDASVADAVSDYLRDVLPDDVQHVEVVPPGESGLSRMVLVFKRYRDEREYRFQDRYQCVAEVRAGLPREVVAALSLMDSIRVDLGKAR
jgi:hypothetical protein